MAKFIEIEAEVKQVVTVNIDHISSIHDSDGKTYIYITNPTITGLIINQPYDQFMRWFLKQLREYNDLDSKYSPTSTPISFT